MILLLEDDRALGAQVAQHLADAGYASTWYQTAQQFAEADLHSADAVILDLMLPDAHGFDILKDVRAHSDIPAMVLSAQQDTADRVRAFRLGADDYLTKPFWPEELVERIRARLRRPVIQRGASLRVGPLDLNQERRHATHHGRRLALTRVEFDLLFSLAKRKGEAISREWIRSHVLDQDRQATTRTLDAHVSRLRRKLGTNSLIETVWGIGYRLRDEGPV